MRNRATAHTQKVRTMVEGRGTALHLQAACAKQG
jgi:hypothetical protein